MNVQVRLTSVCLGVPVPPQAELLSAVLHIAAVDVEVCLQD